MDVTTLSGLVDAVKESDKDNAALLIERYGNLREERGIEHGWRKSADVHRKLKCIQQKKLKNAVIDYDEENRCLSLEEFIRFFAAVEDELKVTMELDGESRDFALNLHDFMWNRLGNIKVDRRFIFKPE